VNGKMKYIRTKDGIYRNASTDKDIVIICKNRKLIVNPKGVIAQSDTIEELCDEFVRYIAVDNIYNLMRDYDLNDLKLIRERLQETDDKFYGAIWTDKGLIFVAKMNDKGELELL